MLRNDFKSIILFYLKIILVWIAAAILFVFLRNYGHEDDSAENILKRLNLKQLMVVVVLVGVLTGSVYSSIELLFDRPYFQKHSYGRIILGKLIFSFFAVKIIMAIMILVTSATEGALMEPAEVVKILRSKTYWVLFVYFLLVASLISFTRMVNQKFGPGVLWNMFIGRYRNPREELRVFMFLDLKVLNHHC